MPLAARGFWFVTLFAIGLTWIGSEVVHGRQNCVTGFTPATLIIPVSGATASSPATFTVEAPATCIWMYEITTLPDGTTFTGFLVWLGFPSQLGGTGSTSVSFGFVYPNHEGVGRSLMMRFGGRTLPITQAANPCPLTISPSSIMDFPANGGTGSFTVNTTGSSCSYTAFPLDDVTVVSGATGTTFPATVTFSVPPNRSQNQTSRGIQVSSVGSAFLAPGVYFAQAGAPVATDAPPNGYRFAVHRGGSSTHTTAPEPLSITNAENPSASWTASTNQPWLVVTPSSGVSPGRARISIDATAAAILSPGFYYGAITLTSSVAPQTPRTVVVSLAISAATSTAAPFGRLDIPVSSTTPLSGAIPMGGWAVDDVGIAKVQLYRSPVPLETNAEIYLGDATRVRGARPDVLDYQPASGMPEVTRAGWGFMLLSNVLPSGTNGVFTLSAYAEDIEGYRTLLGRTTVTFDNATSPLPFGTIDVPTQGGTASGTLANQGWVLARPGRTIPLDGSSIGAVVDGSMLPNVASYGHARPDVASYFPFPTYANANGPAALLSIDTTTLADGLHTIAWFVTDDAGVAQGIGSRFFTIDNGVASQVAAASSVQARSAAAVRALPRAGAFVWNRQGFNDSPWSLLWSRARTPEIRQEPGERREVALDTWWWSSGCSPYQGYLLTGDVAGPLPAGASIDGEKGVFSWLPPVEFGGTFEFVFVRRACTGREERIPLRVTIAPR